MDELEAELERLQDTNSELVDRNAILEKYLQLKDSPAAAEGEGEEWWLDARTREYIFQAFEAPQSITFTVCESRPLKLTCAEVSWHDG